MDKLWIVYFCFKSNEPLEPRVIDLKESLSLLNIHSLDNPSLDEIDQTVNQNGKLAVIFIGKKINTKLLVDLKKYEDRLLRVLYDNVNLSKIDQKVRDKLDDLELMIKLDSSELIREIKSFYSSDKTKKKEEVEDLDIDFNID